jgi:hypothetical protein
MQEWKWIHHFNYFGKDFQTGFLTWEWLSNMQLHFQLACHAGG